MEPLDEPGVPVSCTSDQPLKPSRFAEATALEGSAVTELDPELGGGLLDPPDTVNVVLTVGHSPLLTHDL
jgi:hypothetical protein